jgi:hypothetical protein
MRSFHYLIIAVLFLSGCHSTPAPKPQPPATALGAERQAVQATFAWQAAHIDAYLASVPKLQDPQAWISLARVVRSSIPVDVVPTAEDKTSANTSVAAAIAGKLAVVEAESKDTKLLLEKITTTRAATDAALAESNKAIDALKAENVRLAQEAELKVTQAVQFWFALGLRVGGAALWLAAGARLYAAFQSPLGIGNAIKSTGILFALGSAAFSLSWAVAQWWFYWACGGITFLTVGLLCWLAYRHQKDQHHISAADDVIAGVEDVRSMLKNPTAELAELVRGADTTEKAIAAVRKLGHAVGGAIAQHVTEADGTAALVDARRRAMKLI